jgi:tetratricopeptide (TPR) repeat protein
MDSQSLDCIGILEGTNKSSLGIDYLRHYERIIGDRRNDTFQFLEIGIAEGSSLRMWTKFFPNAQIIGVDINAQTRAFARGRVSVEIGSQADPDFLSGLAKKYRPAIILDDGSHMSDHVWLTFEHLFPSLLPGGVYIMEDLFLHYGDNARRFLVPGSTNPTERLASLATRVTGDYLEPGADDATKYLRETIDRVEFIKGAIAIHKRRQEDPAQYLAYLTEAAQQADHHLMWFHLSMAMIKHQEFDRAEAAARKAIGLLPQNVHYRHRLAWLQSRRGDFPAAIATLRDAQRFAPDDAGVKTELAALQAKLAAAAP